MMKKIFSFLLALLLCCTLCAPTFAVVDPSERYYVADYANVLSKETEDKIVNYNGSLEYQCNGAQIVVVTVTSLDGMYCDDYAYELFNTWRVGSGTYNNGMLLLLAPDKNKAWLATGAGISLDADEMLDKYFWKEFDKGNYDTAVNKLFDALLKWYDAKYDASTASSGSNDRYESDSYRRSSGLEDFVDLLVTIAVLYLIFVSIFGSGRRGGRGGRGGGSFWPWLYLLSSSRNNRGYRPPPGRNPPPPRGGFGGGSFGGGHSGGFGGGGFGGGMGRGGGGFGGGGGGRR